MGQRARLEMGTEQMHRRRFLKGALAVAGAVAAVAPGAALAASDEDSSESLAGPWLERVVSTDGSFPPFQTLFSFDSTGGLGGTASIDAMPGLKSSPTVGAWRHLSGRRYIWTGHAFSFDDAGNPNGLYNIIETITLDSSAKTYSGAGTFEVVGGLGAFPLTPYTVTATRITT